MKLIVENWREFILNEGPSTGKWVGCPEGWFRDPKTRQCTPIDPSLNLGFAVVPAGAVAQAIVRATPALARSKETLAMLAAVVSQKLSDLISDDPAPSTVGQKSPKVSRQMLDKVVKDVVKNYPNHQEDEEEDEELNCAFASPKMLEITTKQDRTTRSVVVVRHPDQTVTAYFKSSGISGTGAKGRWIPFEGWVTEERVPKGHSYGNGEERLTNPEMNKWRDLPYAAYVIMAKTYYGHAEYPMPMGSKHDLCSRWLSRMESTGELMKLTKISRTIEHIFHRDGWRKTYHKYANLNNSLIKFGAIDQSRPVFRPNRKGRRLLFGVDEIS